MSLNLNDVVTDGSAKFQVVKSATDLDVSEEIAQLKNKLGYRQKNKTYAVGDIAYHSDLPAGWYLECTTAGTTNNSELTISSPSIGGTVTDGTVTWIVKRLQNMFYQSFAGEHSFTDLNDITKTGLYEYDRVTNNPLPNFFGNILVTGCEADYSGANWTSQMVIASNAYIYTRSKRSDVGNIWSPWLQSEQIVAKSLGTNGYIKYASGLIMQWGFENEVTNTEKTVNFPISFTDMPRVIAVPIDGIVHQIYYHNITTSGFGVLSNQSGTTNHAINYFAIGK